MSVRAHLVEEVRLRSHEVVLKDGEKLSISDPTFNLWHDEAVKDWLEENTDFWSQLNDDACGIASIEVEKLEDMHRELVCAGNIDKETAEMVEKDIAWAKENKRDYLQYDCF